MIRGLAFDMSKINTIVLSSNMTIESVSTRVENLVTSTSSISALLDSPVVPPAIAARFAVLEREIADLKASNATLVALVGRESVAQAGFRAEVRPVLGRLSSPPPPEYSSPLS